MVVEDREAVGHLLAQLLLLVRFHQGAVGTDGHDDLDPFVLDPAPVQFLDDERQETVSLGRTGQIIDGDGRGLLAFGQFANAFLPDGIGKSLPNLRLGHVRCVGHPGDQHLPVRGKSQR